ncbi:MAG: hypothetical protein ACI8TP_000733 [Acidimicrobiales bacterium]
MSESRPIEHTAPDDAAFAHDAETLVELFESGEIEVEGRMPNSSNTTLLVTVTGYAASGDKITAQGIYKPGDGERPLWDFPPDLYKREVAMYRLAAALGMSVIPATTIGVGPLGEGSIQAFVNADFSQHYFTMYEDGVAVDDLRQLGLLDLIANNTDRKSGHCLLGRDGRSYGIDHGLAFHHEWKLRTVIWDFIGEPIPDADLEAIQRFVDSGPPVELSCLLNTLEVDAMMTRAQAVLNEGLFPDDDSGGHRWPWPLV